MDFSTVVEGRRSIRKFVAEAVPDDDIEEIIQIGTLAPNAGNKQDWFFIAITNDEIKIKMKEVVQNKLASLAARTGKANPDKYKKHLHTILFADAPLVIVVLTKPYRSLYDGLLSDAGYSEAEIDCLRMRPDLQTVGGAVQTMLLKAYSMGYGSCWMVAPNLARHELEDLLNISPPWSLAALIAVGKPLKKPENRKLKPLTDVYKIIK